MNEGKKTDRLTNEVTREGNTGTNTGGSTGTTISPNSLTGKERRRRKMKGRKNEGRKIVSKLLVVLDMTALLPPGLFFFCKLGHPRPPSPQTTTPAASTKGMRCLFDALLCAYV